MKDRETGLSPIPDYSAFLLGDFLEKAVLADSAQRIKNRTQRKQLQADVLKSVWGTSGEPALRISPSTIANCLRWVGFEALGYPQAPRTFESEMGLLVGSGAHNAIQRILQGFGITELYLINDEYEISGRLDYLMKVPRTNAWHIGDFKFVSDFAFRKITREGLSGSLKNTKGNYHPATEARLQVLLYMWMKRNEGLDVQMGNVFYINKNDNKKKEALVPWDSLAEYDISEILEKIKVAWEQIQAGVLPDPTVQSEHICASFCPYRAQCEYGKEFAAGRVRRESRRRPPWVYNKRKVEEQDRQTKMEVLGIAQPSLFTLDPSQIKKR